MIIIDFCGHPGTGKSTLMNMIEDKDILRWVDLPPVNKFKLCKHLISSKFFWKNLILILRASRISGFHGRKRLRSKFKNLEVILHFIYQVEQYSNKYKIYVVEKGPLSVLPVGSGVKGYQIVERLLDKLVDKYPYSIFYFYSDAPTIIKNMKKRKTSVDERMLEAPSLKRRIKRSKRVLERNINWIDEKLVHKVFIKSDNRSLDENLKIVNKEIKKVRKKVGILN